MIALTLALAFGVALLRGGSIARLTCINVVLPWLVILAFGMRVSLHSKIGIYFGRGNELIIVQLLSHLMLASWLLINRDLKGARLAIIGVFANAIVIGVNGGRMPVLEDALLRSGQEHLVELLARDGSRTHQLLNESTQLPWLADIFALPAWWPFAVAFSIGDVLIALGVFLFIQHQMGAGSRRRTVLQ